MLNKPIIFNTFLLALSSLFSGLLGLLRDRLLASRFGAGSELDAYFIAFRIPDFIYGILVIGGLSAVFLPLLTESFRKGEREGWYFVNMTLNSFFIFIIFLAIIFFIIAPLIMSLIAPGFTSEQLELATLLTRFMLLSPVLLGLSSIFSGILHYFNRFIAYSLAPILYNIGIILGIIFLVPFFGVTGLAFGVILGAFLHLLAQFIPVIVSCGFRYTLLFNLKNQYILRMIKLVSWRALGVSVYNLNLIIIAAIASTISVGSITVLNFANNVSNFITGILGVSFAVAVFPNITKEFAEKGKDKFWELFKGLLKKIVLVAILFSLLLFIFRNQIVEAIFKTGMFSDTHAVLTAAMIAFLSIGIPASVLSPLLLRGFFAMQDVKTPTKIGIFYVLLTLSLSLFFVWIFGFKNITTDFVTHVFNLREGRDIKVIGLTIAVSISTIIYSLLLLFFLKRRVSL